MLRLCTPEMRWSMLRPKIQQPKQTIIIVVFTFSKFSFIIAIICACVFDVCVAIATSKCYVLLCRQVNARHEWEEILEDFRLPASCVNSAVALKQIYMRWVHEQLHNLSLLNETHGGPSWRPTVRDMRPMEDPVGVLEWAAWDPWRIQLESYCERYETHGGLQFCYERHETHVGPSWTPTVIGMKPT